MQPLMATNSDTRQANVLSIQSHVVHGYVGNKAAVLPLQLLGIDVAPLNSVHFSNHTGYSAGFKGQVLDGDALLEITAGLEANGLLAGFTHMLTGYIGSETFLRAVLEVRRRITAARGGDAPQWICDPVLGDDGKLYVPPALVAVYRAEVVRNASVLTPNQFECEQLSGVAITDRASALAACSALHSTGARAVLITSATYSVPEADAATEAGDQRKLRVLGSRDGCAYEIAVPQVDGSYTGTGDMVAALVLAWLHRTATPQQSDDGESDDDDASSGHRRQRPRGNLAYAMESAIATVQAVIERTPPGTELRLVQSRFDIMEPPRRLWSVAGPVAWKIGLVLYDSSLPQDGSEVDALEDALRAKEISFLRIASLTPFSVQEKVAAMGLDAAAVVVVTIAGTISGFADLERAAAAGTWVCEVGGSGSSAETVAEVDAALSAIITAGQTYPT